jgi:tripartite-type tricarboxylate transporter receptor subunit TctC
MKRRAILGGLAIFGSVSVAHTQQAYPVQPIRMVIPNPPGGGSDFIARALGERAAVHLGGQVVAENRAGGSTIIGANFVARSAPDGYTILTITTAGIVQGVIQETLPYNLERDFVPIIGVGSEPLALAVSSSSNIRSLADLTAAARSSAGVTFGSGGAGTMSHLACVRLLGELRGSGTHVPFRGTAPALQALAGGHIQMMFPGIPDVRPAIDAGHARVLGVTSAERMPLLPEVPTTRELGFPDFNPRLWYGFVAPAGTPSNIIVRLHEAFLRVLQEPEMQQRLASRSFTIEVQNSEAAAAYMRDETVRWGQVVRDNNLRATD